MILAACGLLVLVAFGAVCFVAGGVATGYGAWRFVAGWGT